MLTVIATEWSPLQHFLMTESLSGYRWLISVALGAIVLVVIEVEKAIRRHRIRMDAPFPVEVSVGPARAITGDTLS